MIFNHFYFFILSDLENLKFALLVTLIQRYVSSKLKVSTVFLFRKNRRHVTDGRTDRRGATLLPRSEGRIIAWSRGIDHTGNKPC